MHLIQKIYFFYYEGFKSMQVGKKLWVLIGIKLFILFAVIKWIYFPNYLETHFQTDEERSHYMLNQLTKEN